MSSRAISTTLTAWGEFAITNGMIEWDRDEFRIRLLRGEYQILAENVLEQPVVTGGLYKGSAAWSRPMEWLAPPGTTWKIVAVEIRCVIDGEAHSFMRTDFDPAITVHNSSFRFQTATPTIRWDFTEEAKPEDGHTDWDALVDQLGTFHRALVDGLRERNAGVWTRSPQFRGPRTRLLLQDETIAWDHEIFRLRLNTKGE